MIKLLFIILITVNVSLAYAKGEVLTTIDLKYINAGEVISVLESFIDKSVSISKKNNTLIINATPEKTKNILPVIAEMDTLPTPLTIEFIASNKKIDFNSNKNTYQTGKNKNNTSQSMAITERQWVTLNTGLSIPVAERKRYADGTETQSFTYKKVSKSYVFKVHEFSGWSIIQVGLNSSTLSDDIAGAIEHTKLDTTIVGKTGDWLEVASAKEISTDENSTVYSTSRPDKQYIYLYVKVVKQPDTEKK